MCNAKWRLHLVFEKKLAGSENKAKKKHRENSGAA
ncbi:hypothetical protein IOK_20155 [Yersinia enterocolitica subsp. palearctica PhRBD_Ye1]|nr:hypothetical protein IOK_20155 [Yersinia enterocolitica subsp. palearctica PhRBD_Ye1]